MSLIARASSRGGVSFSPPALIRESSASSGVAVGGIPWAKSRTVPRSTCPLSDRLLPTMSLSSIASMSAFLAFASCAQWVDPFRPCSSPATARNTRVALYLKCDMTRASSRTDAVPDASSSAPGAGLVASRGFVARES